MKALLNALKPAIKTGLTYLRAVEVIDSELLPLEEPGFPFVGLLDGGTVEKSMPGKKDLEELTVKVVPYQSILLDEPGAGVMGSTAQLGDQGTGVLDMAAALKTLLNDNFLGLNFHFAHLQRREPSQALSKDSGLIVMKPLIFNYRRYV